MNVAKVLALIRGADIIHSVNDNVDIDSFMLGIDPWEMITLTWTDEEGSDFEIKFSEDGLKETKLVDGNLVIPDIDGDEVELSLYTRKHYFVNIEEID